MRREGDREARWVLLDYVDVVVHVQHVEERVYYSLERIWRDCPVIAAARGRDGVPSERAAAGGQESR